VRHAGTVGRRPRPLSLRTATTADDQGVARENAHLDARLLAARRPGIAEREAPIGEPGEPDHGLPVE